MEIKFLALIVAAALNPLVARTPEPNGIVPADCEVSDRLPMTRVAVVEPVLDDAAPLPPVRPVTKRAPTSTATSTARTNDLEPLQNALARNDRPAFDAALARAKEAGAPTRVYEDIARVWDAQFEGPFFSQDSEAYRIASGYPGYEAAVRRQILTDSSGRKFYPAAESRAFLGQQVGVAAPATRRASAAPSPSSSSRRVEPSPQRRVSTPMATKRSSPSSSSTSSKARKTAATRESVTPPRPSPDPSAATRPAAAAPAPVVPPAVDISSTSVAPPAAGSFEPAADTAVDTMSDAPATTTVEQAPATTPAPATAPSKSRSIILPAILILIGLGVLILLFRTAK